MKRLLALAILIYLPHLAEEALTGMHDDPLIAFAFAPLEHLSPRHATYLVFQVMLALTLFTTWLFSAGRKPQLIVMTTLGIALIGEGHHLLRALSTWHDNSGLLTSLPMPILGAYLLHGVARAWRLVNRTFLT